MCNIAAYAGDKQAAPILIEMLRRQQAYDGFMSCGLATVHEGKLHWRKIVGNVEKFVAETDVLSLPGTIGIAHTRPSGNKDTYEVAHPYISMDGEMAVVSNGTTPQDRYTPQRNAAVQMLDEAGFVFKAVSDDPKKTWPRLKNGKAVGTAEVRVHLVDYYIKRGKTYTEAMALAAQQLYSDNVFLMLNQNVPDKIHAIRTVRPMNVLLGNGETYLATTRIAFPDDVEGESMALPLMHVCEITGGGFAVTKDKIKGEKVCEITPLVYAEGYTRVVAALKGKKDAPLGLSDIGRVLKEEVGKFWPEQHTYDQHVLLAYRIIEQLYSEKRLNSTIITEDYKDGPRDRVHMWID